MRSDDAGAGLYASGRLRKLVKLMEPKSILDGLGIVA